MVEDAQKENLDPARFGESRGHESYGRIGFSWLNQPALPLYGSELMHRDVILVEIHESRERRHLSQEWHDEGRIIFRGYMSANQFAQAITHQNSGGGSCITVAYVAGDDRPHRDPPPLREMRPLFDMEVHESIEEVVSKLESLRETLPTVKSKKAVDSAIRSLRASMPFIESQFTLRMNDIVTDAKAEIEAFAQRRLECLGQQSALGSVPPSTGESNEISALEAC